MSKEQLEELLNDLPYSIRYSGELEPLKQFVREQAERVQKLEEDTEYLSHNYGLEADRNKRYRDLFGKILNSEFDYAEEFAMYAEKIAEEALEESE